MLIKSFFAYKLGQKRIFDDKGKSIVVTEAKIEPLSVVRIKTKEKDGYQAFQVLIKNFKSKKENKHILREIKFIKDRDEKIEEVKTIKASDVFKVGEKVQVRGWTKGRGFAGVVKRWGFRGGPKTHGQSDRLRAPGSIGQRTTPGRVWKGKKMAGRMGNQAKTIKGLKIWQIDEEKKVVLLKGLVPGKKGGLLKISKQDIIFKK